MEIWMENIFKPSPNYKLVRATVLYLCGKQTNNSNNKNTSLSDSNERLWNKFSMEWKMWIMVNH